MSSEISTSGHKQHECTRHCSSEARTRTGTHVPSREPGKNAHHMAESGSPGGGAACSSVCFSVSRPLCARPGGGGAGVGGKTRAAVGDGVCHELPKRPGQPLPKVLARVTRRTSHFTSRNSPEGKHQRWRKDSRTRTPAAESPPSAQSWHQPEGRTTESRSGSVVRFPSEGPCRRPERRGTQNEKTSRSRHRAKRRCEMAGTAPRRCCETPHAMKVNMQIRKKAGRACSRCEPLRGGLGVGFCSFVSPYILQFQYNEPITLSHNFLREKRHRNMYTQINGSFVSVNSNFPARLLGVDNHTATSGTHGQAQDWNRPLQTPSGCHAECPALGATPSRPQPLEGRPCFLSPAPLAPARRHLLNHLPVV